MDLETTQTTTTAKFPILKQGKYDMWRLRIEQYFQVQDYALWDVIDNGNSFKPTAQTTNTDGTLTTLIPGLVTTEENVQKKNDVKERSMLLMALPNEHLMTFNQYKDAKTFAPSTESLDSIFNMIQKIVSQLAILGENISQEDLNLNFLRSLPSAWNSHVVVWRNKPDLDTMSFDDLYNNFKIVEQEVKGTASSNDIEEMDLKWQLALLSMRTRRFFQKTSRNITINVSDTAGYDKSKVKCFNYHKMRHFTRECRGSRNQDSRNRNQDNSRRTVNVEETSSKAIVAIDRAATYKRGLASVEEQLVFYKKNKITDKSRKGVGFVSYNVVPPPHIRLFSPPNLDLSYSGLEEFQHREFEGYGPKTSKSVSEDISNEVRESPDAHWLRTKQQQKPVRKPVKYAEMYRLTAITIKGKEWNIVPRAVLMKTGLRPLNTARPVNTAHPKTTVYSARPMPKAVNTARPNSAVVNAVRENQGHLQKEDQCYVDNRCSRGGAKGGKITGKGTLKSSKLDFKDVYFVKELQFNLFSVSQMCDKKNSVLFTDTGCFVLSPDFKLADESQVLLKVPRKNNMYSVDIKNIVPKESLTCLVAKATLDESMLWHRRLGHVNFKTINKLVKENLMRGLPIKRFENDQTCVACLKGKQHKASCKSKIQNSITQPLFMLHMDLFGPTFVSSLMNKKYCLVVTDDYSRFTWVFFLATKDETSGILKSFITEVENLVDKKVKIIRCNNGTEFKNRAEAVNTACYVQNRVLVVKPHNKTPYELFRGRTPALSFMRPFGCHVTILNTLDYLGKFDGKSDEGFFVGYSLNSKAFRVYNIRTRKVEENLHIRFLEDKPIIAGDGPKWLFDIDVLTKSMNYVPVVAGTNSNDLVGTEESIGAGHSSKETGSSQDYILMPLWKDGSLFDSSSKNASNDEPQPSSDAGKKDDEGVNKESGIDDQERPKNSTQDVNTTGPSINTASTNVNTGSLNINTVSPIVTTAPLEATHADFFGDETEVDMSNITTTYPVPSTPNTRIHKDHSLDHVIGDVQSGVQTRRMTKTTNEQGFISAVYEGKTHKDLYTCLFACFLSRKEPKRNKKGERGIVIRNKARLVVHGYTQEEGIDYNEVLALIARIEAIRLFLAYTSFKDFVVYQMDMKSVFLVEKALYRLHQALRAWYETLSTYLLDNRFQKGQIDKTLFIKRVKSDILLVQVYVEDIIFGSTKKELCTEFDKLMHKKFQMSFMGELTFFLGLQVLGF
ncbi:putative ribonuclease H-like domain-containing protein [Tanacetum coccineum]|uniref:Ribonuclease H-like domain-containing protein n=1 Tax=Tanacetum coccineum TaxID=301880 RepID=A0ABQ5AJL8_9ASTR